MLKKIRVQTERSEDVSGEIEKGQDESKLAMAYKVVLISFYIN